MIKVLIKEKENSFHSLTIKGHANSAPYGEDLICAAVTAVAVGGLNNIQNPDNFNLEVKEGLIVAEVKNEISEHDAIVMETIIAGLKSIEESHGKYINIKLEKI